MPVWDHGLFGIENYLRGVSYVKGWVEPNCGLDSVKLMLFEFS